MIPHFIRITGEKSRPAPGCSRWKSWRGFFRYSGYVLATLCLATSLRAEEVVLPSSPVNPVGAKGRLTADLLTTLDGQTVSAFRVLPVTTLSPSVRETPHTAAPLVLSPGVLAPFLSDPMLMDEVEVNALGRVIAGPEGNALLGQFSRFLAQALPPSENGLYTVFRRGDVLVHPVSGERLSTTARVVGVARLDEPGAIATLTMISSVEEAIPGDHLIAHQKPLRSSYLYPATPRVSVDAYVVSTFGSTSGAGGYSLVAISVGSDDGINPGDILTSLYPEQTILLSKKVVSPAHAGVNCRITDVKEAVAVRVLRCDERVPSRRELTGKAAELVRSPEGRSGDLLVIHVFDRVSYALVRRAEREVQAGDRVVSPGV